MALWQGSLRCRGSLAEASSIDGLRILKINFPADDASLPNAGILLRSPTRRFPTMFTPKGKFGWYELMTSDPKAAGKFYSDVVGWTTKDVGGDGMPYTTFNIGEAGIAGILQMPGHTAWVGYI